MRILTLLILFYVQSTYSFSLKDILPKYDIIKVRNQNQSRAFGNNHRHTVLDFIGLVERHAGYIAEQHKITTRDGYILRLHRMMSKSFTASKPVVFLKHGATMSSDGFVLIGPGKDLAYLLADAGYDVWLGNARGNTYSRSHVILSPGDKKFWEFSYHEIGLLDLSASIDYILKVTGQTSLIYIGYSMGAPEILVLLSTLTEYNEKINLVVLMAPVVFWRYKTPTVSRLFGAYRKFTEIFIDIAEYYEFLPHSSVFGKLGRQFCNDENQNPRYTICGLVLNLLSDLPTFNTSAIPTILEHWPAGTSARTLKHYWQTIDSGEFQAYDAGVSMNWQLYGSERPPLYDLAKVTTAVAIVYGENDLFVTPKNLKLLKRRLPNVVSVKRVPFKNFNHIDFVWSTRAKELVYDDLIKFVKNYTNFNVTLTSVMRNSP